MTADEHCVGRPAPALRPYVSRYVGYRQLRTAGTHQGLPSRSMTMVLSLAEPTEVVQMPRAGRTPVALDGLIGGLHDSAVTIGFDGLLHGIHIDLTPWAGTAIFGLPAAELAHGVHDVADVLGTRGRELVERVRSARAWPERFGVLDEVLGAALRERATASAEVHEAWRTLVATDGAIPVHRLAEHVGWSRRHLGERFREAVGVTPKTLGRILRFENSRAVMVGRRFPRLSDVAAECGYTDQSHLTREWRDLAGLTPGAWLAEELPFVQAGDLESGAGSSHG